MSIIKYVNLYHEIRIDNKNRTYELTRMLTLGNVKIKVPLKSNNDSMFLKRKALDYVVYCVSPDDLRKEMHFHQKSTKKTDFKRPSKNN